jgi:hypothetical protein
VGFNRIKDVEEGKGSYYLNIIAQDASYVIRVEAYY